MQVLECSVAEDNTFGSIIDKLLDKSMSSEKLLDNVTLRNNCSGRAMRALARSLLLRSHGRLEVGGSWAQSLKFSVSVRGSFNISSCKTTIRRANQRSSRGQSGRNQTHSSTHKSISTCSLEITAESKVEFLNDVAERILLTIVVRNTERYSFEGKGRIEVVLFLLDDERTCDCLQPHERDKLLYTATVKAASLSSVLNIPIVHAIPEGVIHTFKSLHCGFYDCRPVIRLKVQLLESHL